MLKEENVGKEKKLDSKHTTLEEFVESDSVVGAKESR